MTICGPIRLFAGRFDCELCFSAVFAAAVPFDLLVVKLSEFRESHAVSLFEFASKMAFVARSDFSHDLTDGQVSVLRHFD